MVHHYHKVNHYVRRSLVAAAFVLFLCDLIAAIWPAFNSVWSRAAHVGVAFASISAFLVEHFINEEDEKEEARHAAAE